ncbi:MAG: arginine decarboxylase [Bacteroidota bacterium]
MTNTYFDLIDQTFHFPQEGFEIEQNNLRFHGISLKSLIEKYGTPFKVTYVPKIGQQIEKARHWFNTAITATAYAGQYHYCYCTKSCHFSYVLDEVLHHKVNLETSSEFDIDIINRLYRQGKIAQNHTIICNGFKTESYTQKISQLINKGFQHTIPILDNLAELQYYEKYINQPCSIGLRIATEEEPNFEFYTSRLGIRASAIVDLYQKHLLHHPKFQLKMLHFFVDTGIKDSMYYWGELEKVLHIYCAIKKICPSLDALNIGGGLPISNSLAFDYDYQQMIQDIVWQVQQTCRAADVPEPDLYTEFGKFTVGESGATIFSVLAQKQQNDRELWYMIDNSLMNTLPDAWGIGERFILLPINKWNNAYTRVNIGGLTCDNSDYYDSEAHEAQVYLPAYEAAATEPLYLGFFHTGAYQDAISGYGGIKHCLIPSPKHILIEKDEAGKLVDRLYRAQQTAGEMLNILGY